MRARMRVLLRAALLTLLPAARSAAMLAGWSPLRETP